MSLTTVNSRNIPPAIITSVENKDGEIEKYYSWLEGKKFEIVVLVNKNSASASEILASCIKESGAGIVIGERTYGKGTVQKVFKDGDGNYLKITTGEYFTRNSNKIDGIGLEPDVDVKATGKMLKLNDTQLDKAIEYLSAKIKN